MSETVLSNRMTDRRSLTNTDGVELKCSDEGNGQPVLLLHGLLCHSGHWVSTWM